MVAIGPFIPHSSTPLKDEKTGTLETPRKVLALTRLVTRNTHLPAKTAVGTIDAVGRQKALACGANVIMPNGTPKEFRRHYRIYPSKICLDESPQNCRFCTEGMVSFLRRKIGKDYGHTLKRCPAGVS
jgi:biotin synthase